MAMEKKASLWVWIHRLAAKLPRPKLARRSVAFQQKAKTNADATALRLLKVFSMTSLLSVLQQRSSARSADTKFLSCRDSRPGAEIQRAIQITATCRT
jgi:hypothetical protein